MATLKDWCVVLDLAFLKGRTITIWNNARLLKASMAFQIIHFITLHTDLVCKLNYYYANAFIIRKCLNRLLFSSRDYTRRRNALRYFWK